MYGHVSFDPANPFLNTSVFWKANHTLLFLLHYFLAGCRSKTAEIQDLKATIVQRCVETKELEDNNSELKSENDDLKRGDYNEDDKIELLLTERKWLRTEILELKGEVADYEEALKEQEREMKHQSADFFKNWARWNHRIVD